MNKETENRRSVSEANQMVRSIVEVETVGHYCWIRGRIEGYAKSDLGHVYFRLVEDNKSIRCMIRNSRIGDI